MSQSTISCSNFQNVLKSHFFLKKFCAQRMRGSKCWFESRSSFLQGLYRVLNSWNLPSNFPNLEKVWKIEVKSWKNGKKSWFFFLESYNKCFTREIFFSCVSNLIQSHLHVIEEALFPRFFKVSIKEAAWSSGQQPLAIRQSQVQIPLWWLSGFVLGRL